MNGGKSERLLEILTLAYFRRTQRTSNKTSNEQKPNHTSIKSEINMLYDACYTIDTIN